MNVGLRNVFQLISCDSKLLSHLCSLEGFIILSLFILFKMAEIENLFH